MARRREGEGAGLWMNDLEGLGYADTHSLRRGAATAAAVVRFVDIVEHERWVFDAVQACKAP